jgi:predicted nucleic acid-binding protein
MILLDTNVLIYASTEGSPFLEWARRTDEGRFRTYFPSVTLRTP